MALTGYISVGLPIGPNVDNDPYFVTNPKYGLGGLRTVLDSTARDAIINERREVGMVVYVSGENKFYYLSGGTGNAYWVELANGVSSITGTANEIFVSGTTGNITIGLPAAVNISQTLNIAGITIGNSGGSLYVSSGMNIFGNINTTGTLMVDGLIITKTGFEGFSGTAELEPIEHVTLDGGDY
jgi:hypothetical protein